MIIPLPSAIPGWEDDLSLFLINLKLSKKAAIVEAMLDVILSCVVLLLLLFSH